MYDEILYPTDGSDGAAAALEHAREVATLRDARVHLLYVVDTRHDYGVVGESHGTESATRGRSVTGNETSVSEEPGLGGKPENDDPETESATHDRSVSESDTSPSDEPGLGGNPEDDGPGIGGIPEPSAVEDALTQRAESFLKGVTTEFEGLDTSSAVRAGNPHEVILNYIAENDIDLVVMGTRGRSESDRYLLGSVTEKVVRLSDVPVTAVPAAAD